MVLYVAKCNRSGLYKIRPQIKICTEILTFSFYDIKLAVTHVFISFYRKNQHAKEELPNGENGIFPILIQLGYIMINRMNIWLK